MFSFLAMLATLLHVVSGQTTVPTPNAAQLRYHQTDFVALIHYNMATYAHNADPGCDETNWDVKADYATGKTRDPATFNPSKLNTTQWFDSIMNLGANIAILTAKHGCGFTLWPTKAKFDDSNQGIKNKPYGYSVGTKEASIHYDVLREFVNSANAAGVGYGFYYSIMKNFYLCRSFSGTNSCMNKVLPGQHNLTDSEYVKVAIEMAKELWSNYGNLTEIWTDSVIPKVAEDIMYEMQPQAIGTKISPTAWCGTESGYPSKDVGGGPIWNFGYSDHGELNSSQWVPKFCDPQLFTDLSQWFWEPNKQLRKLSDMIPIYHDIVGRRMIMELAFSIDRDGLVEESHAKLYKELGDWVRQCYGSPLKILMNQQGYEFVMKLSEGMHFDRFLLQEDLAFGQRVRKYTIEMRKHDGDDPSPNGWIPLVFKDNDTQAIGQKRILLLKEDGIRVNGMGIVELRLRILKAEGGVPQIKTFGVYKPCRDGVESKGEPVESDIYL